MRNPQCPGRLAAGDAETTAPFRVPLVSEDLFRSPDLLVRKVAPHGGPCCVVTFDSFTDHRTLDRPGFGEAFFDSNAIDAVHVIPRENRWYDYREMADAMAQVHAATRCYDRVVTYGSSMGAYAAIRFAGLAGAHAILALSPQFSIDPATVPWEPRWLAHGAAYDPHWERSLPFPSVDEACVVYDPTDRDVRHIAEFARRFRFQAVRMPHAGHPVTGCLAELGLLQPLLLGMCRGDLDPAEFWPTALARLPNSSQYLTSLAKRLPAWRRHRRLALMHRAVTVAPKDPSVYRCLAIELRRSRRFDEAIEMHRRSMALLPGHPNLMLEYGFTLEASGDIAGAIAVLEDIHGRADAQPIYQDHLDGMRARLAIASASRLGRAGVRVRRFLIGPTRRGLGPST